MTAEYVRAIGVSVVVILIAVGLIALASQFR